MKRKINPKSLLSLSNDPIYYKKFRVIEAHPCFRLIDGKQAEHFIPYKITCDDPRNTTCQVLVCMNCGEFQDITFESMKNNKVKATCNFCKNEFIK